MQFTAHFLLLLTVSTQSICATTFLRQQLFIVTYGSNEVFITSHLAVSFQIGRKMACKENFGASLSFVCSPEDKSEAREPS